MRKTWIGWLCLVVLVSGCGYRFAGGGALPGSVKKVFVVMLENRTVETGVESILTNDLIYEFTRSGTIAPGQKHADARLTGVIESITKGTVSRKGVHTSQERRVTLVLSLRLTGSDGTVLWAANRISDNEEYLVVPDKSTTEWNRRGAIEELSRRLAEKVYYQLTDDF